MIYIFDTSSLRVLENYYPDRFPTFWERFRSALESGSVRSVREVLNELQRQASKDWLKEWALRNRELFAQPGPEETAFVGKIFEVAHFRALVGERQRLLGQPVADPFLVAAARVLEGCVVTEEILRPNAAGIPNVCAHFDIDCTNVEGFLQRHSWTF